MKNLSSQQANVPSDANSSPGHRPVTPERPMYEIINLLERKFLQRLASETAASVRDTLNGLLSDIEELYPDAICSILKLSPDHTLHHYAAPHLPPSYIQLLDGIVPGPRAGSCGTAVYIDRTVIVSDLSTDPLWEGFRNAALSAGFRSCWSVPIHYSSGAILGSFAIYQRQPSVPSDEMLAVIDRLANLIGLVIENRETMDALLLSNERYRLASMATHDMIWDWDVSRQEIYRNEDALRAIYGLSGNELICKIDDWVERIFPEDKESVKEKIQQIYSDRKCNWFEAEYRFIRGDGREVYIHDRGIVMRDDRGHAIRVIGAAQDITGRIKAEQKIQESARQYKHLFQSNPLAMWVVDGRGGRILEVNQKAIYHYGFSKEEFLAMSIMDLLGNQDQRPQSLHSRQEQDNISVGSGRTAHYTRGGALIHVNIFSHPLRYKEQDALLVVANDVTEKTMLQEQLLNARMDRQREIVKATIDGQEKERDEIALELHDNVNQLLSSAKLYFDCLGQYDEDKEKYRLTGINLINDAVEEIRRLSKTLVKPRLRDIGLVLAMDDLFRNISLASPMTVEFLHEGFDEEKVDDDLKLTIYRIVQEQMTNILKHSGASAVSVALASAGDMISLLITDNGQGADSIISGKGIGLSGIANRASLHNGTVTIDSAPGRGFKLRVDFNSLFVP